MKGIVKSLGQRGRGQSENRWSNKSKEREIESDAPFHSFAFPRVLPLAVL